MQLIVVQRQRKHTGVEPALAQLAQDHFGLLFDQQQFQLWETLADPRHHVRQQIRPQRGEDAQPHCAGFRVLAATRGFLHFLDIGDDAPRAFGGVAAGGGQHHPARRAFDQRHAEFILELLDLGRQRRLADEAGCGGAAEMFVVGERNQVLQIAQIHVSDTLVSAAGAAECSRYSAQPLNAVNAGDAIVVPPVIPNRDRTSVCMMRCFRCRAACRF